jgi:hypothetical protein
MLNWFKRKHKPQEQKVVITEGVESTFHYHFSMSGDTTRSLCGAKVMPTNIPLNGWGYVSHINEKYCVECLRINE